MYWTRNLDFKKISANRYESPKMNGTARWFAWNAASQSERSDHWLIRKILQITGIAFNGRATLFNPFLILLFSTAFSFFCINEQFERTDEMLIQWETPLNGMAHSYSVPTTANRTLYLLLGLKVSPYSGPMTLLNIVCLAFAMRQRPLNSNSNSVCTE